MTSFMLRIGKFILDLLTILLAGTLLLGLFAFWRINQGPIYIDFLTPQISKAMNDMLPPGMTVGFKNVSLTWDSKADSLDFRANDLHVEETGNAQGAQVAQLGFSLSLRHLMVGQVRVTGINLYRPQIHILRQSDGRFGFAPANTTPDAKPSQTADTLLATLLRPTQAGQAGPVANLRQVSITDAALIFTDEKLGISWQIPQADFLMQRTASQLSAKGNLDMVLGDQVIPLRLTLQGDEKKPGLAVSLAFSGLDPTLLAPLAPELAALEGVSLPLSGQASLTLDAALMPATADITLQGAAGSLAIPALYPAPLDVRSATLAAGIDFTEKQVSLQDATLDLGGPILHATGLISQGDDDRWNALLETGATNVAIDTLSTFWPPEIGVPAREWVLECLSKGIVSNAQASFSLKGSTQDLSDITLDDISGSLDFEGVRVDYLPPMPIVNDVAGHARFDHDNFNIEVDGGQMKNISIGKSSIPIGGLSTDSEHITLDIALDGSLSAILDAIDGEPLDLAKSLGLVPDKIHADSKGTLHLAFPLMKDLDTSDITVSADATLRKTRVDGLLAGWPITDGLFNLHVDNKGMTVSGSARVADTPTNATWDESFTASAAPTRIQFKTILSDADRKRLDLDFIPRMTGSVGVDGTYTRSSTGDGTLSAALNLEQAAISAPEIALEKTRGSDGTASFLATFHAGLLEKVGNIRLNTDTIDATGEVRLAKDQSIAAINLDELVYGRNDLTVRIMPLEKGGWSVNVGGKVLDLAPFINNASQPQAAPSAPSLPDSGQSIQLAFDVRTALDANGTLFDHFKGRMDMAGDHITSADAAGTLGKQKMTLSFRPDNGDRHRLRIEMTDAGTFLMASDILGTVRGGTLVLDGRTEPRTTPGAPFILNGAIEMKDFVLVDAPVLARILNALSLPGFLELLGSEGFRFSQLYADFTFAPDKIDIREGRTAGASLGITFAGSLDRKKSKLDIGGIVIPVHGLNSVLQAIPLLGNILTGGEGGGLIAATYKISGSTQDPKTSVNPLSILMPGFLRSLFFPEEGSRIMPNTPPSR